MAEMQRGLYQVGARYRIKWTMAGDKKALWTKRAMIAPGVLSMLRRRDAVRQAEPDLFAAHYTFRLPLEMVTNRGEYP